MTVADIIKQIAIVQRSISGIAAAFDNPPESLNKTPCFVSYPDNLDVQWPRSPNIRTKTYDIVMDLYLSRAGGLSNVNAAALPYLDLVTDTFDQNVQLGGTVVAAGVSAAKVGVLSYAGVDYFGVRFTLKALVKQQVVYKG